MGFLFSMIVSASAEFNHFNMIGCMENRNTVTFSLFDGFHDVALKVETVTHDEISVGQGFDIFGRWFPFVWINTVRHQNLDISCITHYFTDYSAQN